MYFSFQNTNIFLRNSLKILLHQFHDNEHGYSYYSKKKGEAERGRGEGGKDVEYNGAMEQMFFKSGERSGSKNLIKAAARRRSHRRV